MCKKTGFLNEVNALDTKNLVSVVQGENIINSLDKEKSKNYRILKPHEVRNLNSFCNYMATEGCSISNFDGFYVSYSIAQIGKEFDLLRFGFENIINIEIKSELKIAQKHEKILRQMQENYYYLKFLDKPVFIFTYVENDGFYEYDIVNDTIIAINQSRIALILKTQTVDYSCDPEKMFLPSNYLISPFNSTDKFIEGGYFLTSAQRKVKDEIDLEIAQSPHMFACISANAGTGKTLLLYDIAKEKINSGKNVLIIHCGKLNLGHIRLINTYKWDILPIRNIPKNVPFTTNKKYDYILVDESQRISANQLERLIEKSIEDTTPIIFSYDVKQYLKYGENTDINEFLIQRFPMLKTSLKKLTTKIRTNKSMASFITNLKEIGKSQDNLNYECVSIDYFDNFLSLKSYIDFLETKGWMPITYTTSSITPDPYSKLTVISDKNAHDVIGQEFSKVVFVMDENFRYKDNKLQVRNSYYSAQGMLYQIVTRVVDELKIIVFNNPDLYLKLLDIKKMGE